jgi:hypothetical protein
MYNQYSDQRREIFHDIRRKTAPEKKKVSHLKRATFDETMALKEKKRPQRKVLTEESFDVTSVDQYI